MSNDDLIDLPLEGREFQVSSRVTSGAVPRWQCMRRLEHAQHVRTASRPDGLALAVVSKAPPRMLFCIRKVHRRWNEVHPGEHANVGIRTV